MEGQNHRANRQNDRDYYKAAAYRLVRKTAVSQFLTGWTLVLTGLAATGVWMQWRSMQATFENANQPIIAVAAYHARERDFERTGRGRDTLSIHPQR